MIRCELMASAFLATLVEASGGDLRAAFAHLCSRVSPADLDGEDFQTALSRAVGQLIGARAPGGAISPAPPANDA
ncbi:hypothetical protein [Methylobacterium gnaphalii]|uniref:hypothetical protein n=1 Tax=Methylobacterium gnaphalii TaxID=1010610 RepID=UPI001EE1ADCF|nr:hypothetical protein [Methylobacterium gnaphalii]GJD69426.1 hypothetical protein MMMDOFMJ_2357 [Methylobacterium gnaphalii]GLS49617.1 hypothetical protein GCM10007885_24660 [Methylobacterium gnaphalii]